MRGRSLGGRLDSYRRRNAGKTTRSVPAAGRLRGNATIAVRFIPVTYRQVLLILMVVDAHLATSDLGRVVAVGPRDVEM
jgi:hypothetical protein